MLKEELDSTYGRKPIGTPIGEQASGGAFDVPKKHKPTRYVPRKPRKNRKNRK